MSTPTIHPIIPKLELHKLRDDELDEYTQEKIDKINAVNSGEPQAVEMLYEDGEAMLHENDEIMIYE